MKKEIFWPNSRQDVELVGGAVNFCKLTGLKKSELTRRSLTEYLKKHKIK